MKKYKIAITYLLLATIGAYAQEPILVSAAKHSIFLYSPLELGLGLKYFDYYTSEQYLPHITGYSIDDNFSTDSLHRNYISLVLYKYGHYTANKDSTMNIDLYFDRLPNGVVYYLEIPLFKPGHRSTHIILDSVKKDGMIYTYKGMAHDITRVIFPEFKKQ